MIIVEPEIVDHVEFSCSDEEFEILRAILGQSLALYDLIDFYLDNISEDDLSHLLRVFDMAEEAPFIMHERDFWALSAVVSRTDTLTLKGVDPKRRDSVVLQMLNVGVSGKRSALSPIGNETYVSKEKQV